MNGPHRPTHTAWREGGGEQGMHRVLALTILLSALASWGAGCGTATDVRTRLATPGPLYQPTNVFRADAKLPASLKRVVVLPLTTAGTGVDLASAPATLEPLLIQELGKSGRFELMPMAPAALKQLTGRATWSASDLFPTNFFDRLRDSTGCDGVLFSEVTAYKAYPPMTVGWRLRLMDVDGPTVWWAVDEVFDASNALVANAAKRYHLTNAGKPAELTDPAEILLSPRRFAGYAASALVETCPKR